MIRIHVMIQIRNKFEAIQTIIPYVHCSANLHSERNYFSLQIDAYEDQSKVLTSEINICISS